MIRLLSPLRSKFVQDESGNGMVEFALVSALIFIPLLFGIIEFGRLTWAKDMVTTAAREGTRFAIVHGADYAKAGYGTVFDSAAVASYVEGKTQLSPIKVQTAWTGKEAGDTVVVTVSYVYTPVVKVPALLTNKTVTGTSTQIVAY